MLPIPSKGFARSVRQHNVDLGTCCDWLEANALVSDTDVSGAAVIDELRENEIYADQNFAWELVNDVFSGIRERGRLIGDGYPLRVHTTSRLQTAGGWDKYPAYSFCLMLSLATSYPQWARGFGSDYTEQGQLFEALTAESMKATLVGWTIHPTGWTRTTPNKLKEVVTRVASLLGEATGELARWTKNKANEAGLDLLCFRPFPDGRVGIPVYLLQCASGGDWESKLKTPDLRIWTKVITFAADPKKAFSMPFALSTNDFRQSCNIVDGLLLDRARLLAPGRDSKDWLSPELSKALVGWLRPRIDALAALAARP